MSGKPSVGVIIPNWNDARYLSRCIGSVLDQSEPADEIIVVDDKSSDNSLDVIRALIKGHSQALLVENTNNLGTYGAVDEGLKRLKSDYVLFLAANDFVLPGIFAHAKASLSRSTGIGLWSALAWLVDEHDNVIRLHNSPIVSLRDSQFSSQQCIDLAWKFGNWFTGTTLIYRRQAVEEIGAFDPAYGGLSDLIAALTIASRHGAAYSPEPYAAIRMHGGSYLSRTLGDSDNLEALIRRLHERGPELAPRLFGDAFLERTAMRFRFAGVRVGGRQSMRNAASFVRGWKRMLMLGAPRVLPLAANRMQTAVAFVALRPFDLLPTLINRLIAWMIVRFKLALRSLA